MPNRASFDAQIWWNTHWNRMNPTAEQEAQLALPQSNFPLELLLTRLRTMLLHCTRLGTDTNMREQMF